MGRARRLLRGRGRALALVAAASVAWLLLDVAALRLSFGGGGGGGGAARPRGRARDGAPGTGGAPGAPPAAPAPPRPGGTDGGAGAAEPKTESGAGRERSGEATARPPGGTRAAAPRAAAGTVPAAARGSRPPPPAGARGRGQRAQAAGPPEPKPGAAGGAQQTPLAAAPGSSAPGITHGAKTGAAPTGNRPTTEAAEAAKDVLKTQTGDGAGPEEASPARARGQARRSRPLPPGLPAPGQIERAEQNGTATRTAKRAEPAAEQSQHRPAGTPGSEGLPTRTAVPQKAPGDHERAAVGEQAAAPENHFVRISKEGVRVGSPAAPNPGADSAGNFTRSPERRPERHRESGKHQGILASRAASAAPGSLQKAAPAEGPQQGGTAGARQGVRTGRPAKGSSSARSPGTHRVLAVDATLAPRDPGAPGQFGHAVAVPEDKQEEAKSRWKEGNFNVYLSDLIPVDRAIADTRPAGCSEQQVHNDLPTTSIIMCFVDEVWSTLLRSVHSVLSRSPPHLIEEVILVDDFSTKDYLKEKLDKYMSQFPKVKILHLKERHGLIRARLAGAEIAKGDVLTFLDSHVECNVGWLEPLLERVRLSRAKVACPVIEVISDKDMSYMTVDNFQRGIFTWPMNFGWRQIPQEVIEKNKIKETDIIRCPVMAGGLFSIDKKYFFELGTYDPGLDVWGGENMEISFKVWMCGGEIEIIPCSRVGHIFRNDNPYSFPKDRIRTVERNLARVAEVWLDEYKDLFYGHAYHLILKNLDVGDLTQQIELRKKLQCKSFKWYLENVYPDLEAPLVKASGLLVNVATARCITVENTTVALEPCDANNEDQKFNYTWLRLLQHGEVCVAPAAPGGSPGLHRCDGRNHRLKWLHGSLARPELMEHIAVEHLPQPACLEADQARKTLRVNACDSSSPHQKWHFGNYYAD